MVDYKLKLTFLTKLGHRYTLTIYDADPELSDQRVNEAMDEIIRLNIFVGRDGSDLVEKYRARLIRTEILDLDAGHGAEWSEAEGPMPWLPLLSAVWRFYEDAFIPKGLDLLHSERAIPPALCTAALAGFIQGQDVLCFNRSKTPPLIE